MTFRLRHDWTVGARVPGRDPDTDRITETRLATCAHCGTLRSESAGGATLFVRRAAEESERVRRDEPPFVAPTSRFRAPW